VTPDAGVAPAGRRDPDQPAGVDGGREEAAEDELRTPQAQAVGFGQPFGDVINDRVTAELLVLDEAASRLLAGAARGRVVPAPVLAKVR
jgi:hypothetical protein